MKSRKLELVDVMNQETMNVIKADGDVKVAFTNTVINIPGSSELVNASTSEILNEMDEKLNEVVKLKPMRNVGKEMIQKKWKLLSEYGL